MSTFVSGATGRVGGTLARELIRRGHEVRTLALPDDPNLQSTREAGITCTLGDLANRDDVAEAFGDADTAFHMAAVISFQANARQLLWRVNVEGTRNVIDAATATAEKHPVRLVFASSDQSYPSRFARYRPTDENHPKEPYSYYGLTKVLGEDMIRFANRTVEGLNTSIAVFSHIEAADEIIDPQGEYSSSAFYVNGRVRSLKEASTHSAGTTTEQEMQEVIRQLEQLTAPDEPLLLTVDKDGLPHSQELTDVRDIVQGLLLIGEKDEAIGETFNLGPAHPVSLGEFIPYLAEATGRRYVEAQIHPDLGLTYASITKARSILGYNPRYTLFDMVDEAVSKIDDTKQTV